MIRRARWESEEGSELIEYALVLPMLLLVVLGIVEFGFLFQRYEVLTNAAREGARMAVLPGYNEPDVDARVVAYAAAAGVANPAVNAGNVLVSDTTIAMGGGQPAIRCKRVIVNYTYTFQFLPGIGSMFGTTFTTVPLQAVSEMRIEDQ
jgi:TadE-like protein